MPVDQVNSLPITENDITYSDDHKEITFTFPADLVETATGSLSVSLYVVDQEGRAVFTGVDTKEDSYFSFTYTCYLGAPDLVVEPGEGAVEEIKDILISCPTGPAGAMINLSYVAKGNIKLTDRSGDRVFAEFTADPVVTEYGTNKDGKYPKQFKFSLDEAITEPGIYVLNIPNAYFALGSEFEAATSKATFVEYEIEGEPEDNTVYDLILYREDVEAVRDDNGAITKVALTLVSDENISFDWNKFSDLELKDSDGNKLDAEFASSSDYENWKVLYVDITYPFVEGESYDLIIPQGAVGTDEWAEGNFLIGHANPTASINFSIDAPLPEVVYDLELTTNVTFKMTDNKITEAIVSFDNGDYTACNYDLVDEGAITLEDANGNTLDATIEPVWDFSVEYAMISVKYAFEADQVYNLVVDEGVFGDLDWEEEEFLTGHANAAMTVKIDTTGAGIENVIAGNDETVDVYNMQGIMIVKDADAAAIKNLPAGLYIIGGKKVAVK